MIDLLYFSLLLAPFAFFWCCCEDSLDCEFCDEGGPDEIDVTLSGVGAGGFFPCEDCSVMNATFTCTRISHCVWLFDPQEGDPNPCNYTISIQMQSNGEGLVRVNCFIVSGEFENVFRAELESPFDCSAPLLLSPVPFQVGNIICDWLSATVELNQAA